MYYVTLGRGKSLIPLQKKQGVFDNGKPAWNGTVSTEFAGQLAGGGLFAGGCHPAFAGL